MGRLLFRSHPRGVMGGDFVGVGGYTWLMRGFLIWALGLGWLLVLAIFWQWPSGDLEVVFCDVGQGDGALILQGFNQVVIDGGSANGQMLDCLSKYMPFWDRHINLMIMSHPQSDHFGGLAEIIGRYEVGVFLAANVVNQTDEFWSFYHQLRASADRIVIAKQGQRIEVGPVKLDVLWPKEEFGQQSLYEVDESDEKELVKLAESLEERQPDDVNDASVVARLMYGNFGALFTGDISMEVEKAIEPLLAGKKLDVLKVAHHGSDTSSWGDMLARFNDGGLAVISVSRDNSYGHPDPVVVERLQAAFGRVLLTSSVGNVRVVSDGESWRVDE